VKVRITCVCHEEIDGVPLAGFEVGSVYRVSTSIGTYLIATGCAEAVLADEPEDFEEQQFRSNVKRWREVAADVARRRPR
jgi:hypothetical protein